MSCPDSAAWGRFRHARRLGHSELESPRSGHFPANYRDGTVIGAAQFLRPANMQSSWREMSISFINKK
jgi:hypothetical protein